MYGFKYMAGQKLKIHGLGQKLNKHCWAKAENTSGDHILTGGLRPPFTTLCGRLRRPHHVVIKYVVSACIFSFCPAMFIQLVAQTVYFQLLPSHVFKSIHLLYVSRRNQSKRRHEAIRRSYNEVCYNVVITRVWL